MNSGGVFILLCIAWANINAADRLVPHSPEWQAKYENFTKHTGRPIIDANNPPIPREQVTYFLYSESNADYPVELTEENLEVVGEEIQKLFILVHGWLEHKDRPWYEDLKNALLNMYPHSKVIQVDYMEPAFDFYPNSVSAAKYVGKYIGEFLIKLSKNRKLSTKKIIILGHSLGSHVSGIAGKTVQKSLSNIGRIIALDPAKPAWQDSPCEKRLCNTDAEVVVGVHTDIGRYGYEPPIGTIDFYPNGGKNQKGCITPDGANQAGMCDHSRSWVYMIEAIRYPNHFISTKCQNWDTFKHSRERCDPVHITLGDLETTEEGSFFMHTNEVAPFAIESRKINIEL